MKYTENYNLKQPEATDFYNVEDFNENAEIIDTELKNLNDNKVDKVEGKGLSTNDFTTAEKNKLASINEGGSNCYVRNDITLDTSPNEFEIGLTLTYVDDAPHNTLYIECNNLVKNLMNYSVAPRDLYYFIETKRTGSYQSEQKINAYIIRGNYKCLEITRYNVYSSSSWRNWSVNVIPVVLNSSPVNNLRGYKGFKCVDATKGIEYVLSHVPGDETGISDANYWLPVASPTQSGRTTVPIPTPNTKITHAVTFDTPFNSVPIITGILMTTVPENILSWSFAEPTTNGFNIYVTRNGTTNTTFHWRATQN